MLDRNLEVLIIKKIKKHLNFKDISIIILIVIIIILLILIIFKNFFIYHEYMANWLAVTIVPILGIVLKIYNYYRAHKIFWTINLDTGPISNIINSTPKHVLIYVKNYSGKDIHDLKIISRFFNVSKKTSKGFISINPYGIHKSKPPKNYRGIFESVSIWSAKRHYRIKDTNGDSESTTPIITNEFLYNFINTYFYKRFGIYRMNIIFFCKRNHQSYIVVIKYKYDKDINKCEVVKIFYEEKNK